jgi:hypothetical protein
MGMLPIFIDPANASIVRLTTSIGSESGRFRHVIYEIVTKTLNKLANAVRRYSVSAVDNLLLWGISAIASATKRRVSSRKSS